MRVSHTDAMASYYLSRLLCFAAQLCVMYAAVDAPFLCQVHLTYNGGTNVTVSWATGQGTIAETLIGDHTRQADAPASIVWLGTAPDNYTTNTSSSVTTSYHQTYTFSNANPIFNYSSPLFHHVALQGEISCQSHPITESCCGCRRPVCLTKQTLVGCKV